MGRYTLGALLILGVLAVFTATAQQRGEELKIGQGDEPDFAGKVLMVNVKDPAQGGVLQKVKVQRLGGRAFLVGQTVKRTENDSQPESVVWFPVDGELIFDEHVRQTIETNNLHGLEFLALSQPG
jgi:hypothetical protein